MLPTPLEVFVIEVSGDGSDLLEVRVDAGVLLHGPLGVNAQLADQELSECGLSGSRVPGEEVFQRGVVGGTRVPHGALEFEGDLAGWAQTVR